MKQLILQWLNGKRNYTVGSMLYNQFGINEEKKALFATGKSALTEKELLKCLQQLLNDEEAVLPKQNIEHYAVMPDESDPVLVALKAEWMPFYTEMNYKRHALDPLLNDENDAAMVKRATLAKDIIALHKKCKAVWLKRDYYVQHGQLPGASINKEVVIDDFEAAKRIENLKTYIRQYRAKLTKRPGDAKAAASLERFKNELTQLQQLHGK